MMEEDIPAVVLDIGGGACKAGFAGDDKPQTVFANVIGRSYLNEEKNYYIEENPAEYIGVEAQQRREMLELRYPMDRGVVTDWEDMKKIWQHIFNNELRITPEERVVLLTEAPLNPKSNREGMAQTMFEGFQVPALYVGLQGVLAYFAAGRSVGIAVVIGDGVTHTVPVYEGSVITEAIMRMDLAGLDLTNYLLKILGEGGHIFNPRAEKETARAIKEKVCYVAADFGQEMATNSFEKSYQLPDNSTITVGNERFRATEALFQPSLLGTDICGIHEMTNDSIMKCAIDTRRSFYNNILLAGGTSKLPGFAERLKNEIVQLAPPNTLAKTVAISGDESAVWIGGSILASVSIFQKMWISKQEYEEHGEGIVHRMCL